MAVIPELETDRLILNKHQVSDFLHLRSYGRLSRWFVTLGDAF